MHGSNLEESVDIVGSCSNCESAFNTLKLLLTDSAGSNLWSGERLHVRPIFNSLVSVNMVDLCLTLK